MMRLRFSFKTLLIVVTLLAIGAGAFGVRLRGAHRQREAVAALRTAGVQVWYDYESEPMTEWPLDPFTDPRAANSPSSSNGPSFSSINPWKLWWGRKLGRDFVCDIKEISFYRPMPSDLVHKLLDLRRIESLKIKVGREFSDDSWQILLKCRNVERLTLEREHYDGTRALTGASRWRQLQSLTIDGGALTIADAEEVARLTNLHQLTLRLVGTTDAALAPLASLKRLEVFELIHSGHGKEVTPAGVAFLSRLHKLRHLALARMPSINDDIAALLQKMPQLESLDLGQATVQGASFDRLAGLTKLKSLNLIGTQVDDSALDKLSHLSQFEELDLGGTRITDAGLAHIATLTNLRILHLSGNNLTDTGIASLAELKQLRELGLTRTAITDVGLKHLAELPNLFSLYLGSEAKVTPKAVAELKKQLPNCNVYQH